jgi:hypothetical protein
MDISPHDHRTLIRIGAVVAATLSALIAWVAMVPLSGIDLVVPAGSGGVRTVDALDVAVAAVLAGLGGVGTVVLVTRRARRPRRTWTILATGVFLTTLLGPIASGAGTGVTWTLIALHSVVAVVLIPQLGRTLHRGGATGDTEPATA